MGNYIYEKTRPGTVAKDGNDIVMEMYNEMFNRPFGSVSGLYCEKTSSGALQLKLKTASKVIDFAGSFNAASPFTPLLRGSASSITLRIPFVKTNDFVAFASDTADGDWVRTWILRVDNESTMAGAYFRGGASYMAYIDKNGMITYFDASHLSTKPFLLSIPMNVNFYKDQADCICCVPSILSADFSGKTNKDPIKNLYLFGVSKNVTVRNGFEFLVAGRKGFVIGKPSVNEPSLIYFYE